MYLCASSIEVAFFYNFSIRLWYCLVLLVLVLFHKWCECLDNGDI